MSKKVFLYSTLSSDQAYTVYKDGGGDLPQVEGQILVKGGANVPDGRMITPEGAVITATTPENLERLRQNEVFKLHEANGFIVVSDHKVDGEVAAADMTGRDQSAPLVPADFEPADGLVGTTSNPDEAAALAQAAAAPQRSSRKA